MFPCTRLIHLVGIPERKLFATSAIVAFSANNVHDWLATDSLQWQSQYGAVPIHAHNPDSIHAAQTLLQHSICSRVGAYNKAFWGAGYLC